MHNAYKKHIPTFVNLIVLTILFVIVLNSILLHNDGHFIYPVDDAYIHLTVAKNFAEIGIPGVNTGEFAYLTSSPLWSLILSLFYLIGLQSELYPLILNSLLAILLVIYLNGYLSRFVNNIAIRTIILISILLLTSVNHLIFIGMEHLLHTLLSLIFVVEILKLSTNNVENVNKYFFSLLTLLLAISRFEALFLIFISIIILIVRRKYHYVIILALSSILPLVVLGIYSISNGWYFMPTPLLLKTEIAGSSDILSLANQLVVGFFRNIYHNEFLIVIILISSLCFIDGWKRIFKDEHLKGLAIIFGATMLHLLFAKVGWFYRYESYFIFLLLIFISIELLNGLRKYNKNKIIITSLLILVLMDPVIIRGYWANTEIVKASNNIYSQQWKVSKFLNKYYAKKTVAVNDIGLISYAGNVKVLDLWGLADLDALRLSKLNKIDKVVENKSVSRYLLLNQILVKNNAKIAVLYKEWFDLAQLKPKGWLEAGSWKIDNNIVCGEDRVVFFAKDSVELRKMVSYLIEYSGYLNNDIEQKIKIGN